MNQTRLVLAIGSLLGLTKMSEKRRLRKLRRSMQDNEQVAPKRYTIEIKVD